MLDLLSFLSLIVLYTFNHTKTVITEVQYRKRSFVFEYLKLSFSVLKRNYC